MAETLDPVERVPESQQHRRVNPTDRSNPEKKDNGFSSALKEKMKEKLKERARGEDEVILDEERQEENEDGESTETPPPQEAEEGEQPVEDQDSDEQETKHVDLKA